MPSRGRHRSTSKECHEVLRRIERIEGVVAVIIGRSYGGKSLGSECRTGSVRVQRRISGGLKAVMQSSKGLQEIYIRTQSGTEDSVQQSLTEFAG